MNFEDKASFATDDGGSPVGRVAPVPPNGDGKSAAEFGRELREWAEQLGCPVIDDGSLEARLHDEPGLADAMLGRESIHPAELPTEAEYPAAARRLTAAIDQALAVSQMPIAVGGNSAHGLDLAGTIEMLIEVQQRLNALQTAHALLLEQARRAGFREEASFIDDSRMAHIGDRSKRQELVDRAVIADIAMALHDSHDDVGKRMAQGQSLVARAPQTLAAAVAGRVAWRNAAFLADQVAELAPSIAARVDSAAASSAATATPAPFRRKVRKIVEDVHPTPMAVRHAEAACKRNVRTDLAADGMGYLTLFAPIAAINAIWDRLSRTAKRVRYGHSQPSATITGATVGGATIDSAATGTETIGSAATGTKCREVLDSRTLEQLRADTAIALLLDDGTLDLATAAFDSTPALSRKPDPAGTPNLAASNTVVGPNPGVPDDLDVPHGIANTAGDPRIGGSADAPDPGCAAAYNAANPNDPVLPNDTANRADADDATDSDDATDTDEIAATDDPRVCEMISDSPFSLARIARSIRPKVFVTIPVLTLLDAADAPALLDGTIPIDPDTARELAGLATSFTRILTDPYHGHVLGVDAKNYRPPADLQQWVRLRDGTCRFPGCTRRSIEADIDHNDEWSKGGATTAGNLNALCRRHHTLKTVGAFSASNQNQITSVTDSPVWGLNLPRHDASRPGQSTEPGAGTGLGDASVSALATTAASATPNSTILWTSPTGRQAETSAEPVPTTIHGNGSRLPRGPMPDADEMREIDDPELDNPDPNDPGDPPF